MTSSITALVVATALQFVAGFVWYTPVFGALWGRIHGVDHIPEEERMRMMKKMGPLFLLQFLMTAVTTVVLALFIDNLPGWNAYAMAAFFWIGFVVPTQVGAVIFGGTEPRWVWPKILVMAGGSLVCLEIAAAVIHLL